MTSPLSSLFSGSAQTKVQIKYKGIDITDDITPNLIEVRYDDQIAFKTDNLEIEIADPDRKWLGEYALERGQTLEVNVTQLNWNYPGEQIVSNFGLFEIYQIEFTWGKSQGNVVTIRAGSIPMSGSLKLALKDKHWEKSDMKTIASQLCASAGMTLNYIAPENPTFGVNDQVQESDIAFLSRLARKEGLLIKVINNTVQIADEKQMEAVAPVQEFKYGQGILEGHLIMSSTDIYATATVTSTNPQSGDTVTGNATAIPSPPVEGNLNVQEHPGYSADDSDQDPDPD